MTRLTATNRWEQLLRYRLIEIVALWEGRLTTRHLREVFGIGRQQASKDINNYKRYIGPGNLVYDPIAKGYAPSPSFTPRVSQGEAHEYLEIITGASDIHRILGRLPERIAATEVVSVPNRNISPKILRPLIKAAREGYRVEVDYVSINQPNREGRIIVPHTLVWTGLRWHVRSWCEKNQDYRDFVLSRFRGDPELLDLSRQTAEFDLGWRTELEVVISPDPRLSAAQRAVVSHDYAMTEDELRLRVRARLLPYLLKMLHLEPPELAQDPKAQQIVIMNLDEISKWLFDSGSD